MDGLSPDELNEILKLGEDEHQDIAYDREECETSLYYFLEHAWPSFDPAPFVGGWHLEAIAEHLEAVSAGEIKRLLINVPPRSCKTSLCLIAWQAWTWAQEPEPEYPLIGPQVQFLCAAYNAKKAQTDAVTARRLIGSLWYQNRWGSRVQIRRDRDNQEQYDTEAGGSRISVGIPESLGKGGVIRCLDDPQKTDEAEAAEPSEKAIREYKEIWSTRSNDPVYGAELLIMQRLGENDLAAYMMEQEGVVHLNLPAEYDSKRHCVTAIGWEDPRTFDGELLWPQRWTRDWVAQKKVDMGPFAWACQFQQMPEPRGGGIIKRDWWRVWPPREEESSWVRSAVGLDGKERLLLGFPMFSYVALSLDGAFTAKEESDWTAATVWGIFEDRGRRRRVMLKEAWRVRCDLHELVQRTIASARQHLVDIVLIEAKANGHDVASELRRLMQDGAWTVKLITPRGDKTARLLRTQPLFADGLVYAPNVEWAQMVIDEVAAFPRGKHDDLVDSTSMGLAFLRRLGLVETAQEQTAATREVMTFVSNPEPLYPV